MKEKEENVKRISISLPPTLLDLFDKVSSSMGYNERSRAIQAAMRNFISEFQWSQEPKSRGSAVILLIYNHEVGGLDEKITDIQHKYRDLVSSTLHIHLDEIKCLAVIVVRGSSFEIKKIGEELASLRGILQLKVDYFEHSV
ncbi:MAG: nickel-responsive transcriptional regulator NikR [Halobacteria archaeon]